MPTKDPGFATPPPPCLRTGKLYVYNCWRLEIVQLPTTALAVLPTLHIV
jgi:hypothetical protein